MKREIAHLMEQDLGKRKGGVHRNLGCIGIGVRLVCIFTCGLDPVFHVFSFMYFSTCVSLGGAVESGAPL